MKEYVFLAGWLWLVVVGCVWLYKRAHPKLLARQAERDSLGITQSRGCGTQNDVTGCGWRQAG